MQADEWIPKALTNIPGSTSVTSVQLLDYPSSNQNRDKHFAAPPAGARPTQATRSAAADGFVA
jgi:hypothetical protein